MTNKTELATEVLAKEVTQKAKWAERIKPIPAIKTISLAFKLKISNLVFLDNKTKGNIKNHVNNSLKKAIDKGEVPKPVSRLTIKIAAKETDATDTNNTMCGFLTAFIIAIR